MLRVCVFLCLHAGMCVCCSDVHSICVCVKLPLLACLYFPCRDTDSPSDKPHLHLQSQLLRLSLFSLISKLPLIPSVLYLAALSLLRPSWKPDVAPACQRIHTPFNVCWGQHAARTQRHIRSHACTCAQWM